MPGHLISLSDFNSGILRSWNDPFLSESRPNGVACPKCSKELNDLHPNLILKDRHPPMKEVHCKHCGWKGERLC